MPRIRMCVGANLYKFLGKVDIKIYIANGQKKTPVQAYRLLFVNHYTGEQNKKKEMLSGIFQLIPLH